MVDCRCGEDAGQGVSFAVSAEVLGERVDGDDLVFTREHFSAVPFQS